MHVWINNSRIAWLAEISMPFLIFTGNLLQDAYINFQERVDDFEVAHKTCSILVWDAVPPKFVNNGESGCLC